MTGIAEHGGKQHRSRPYRTGTAAALSGPADSVEPRVESLGKSFDPVVREAIVV